MWINCDDPVYIERRTVLGFKSLFSDKHDMVIVITPFSRKVGVYIYISNVRKTIVSIFFF